MGHIGLMDKTMISGYGYLWVKSHVVSVCCVLECNTLSSLLQLCQLNNEYQMGTSLCCVFV